MRRLLAGLLVFLLVTLVVSVIPKVNAQTEVFTDGFEDQTFNKWDGNGATSWQIGTTGSGTGGAMDPHTGTYDAWADETHDGVLTSDNIDLSDASAGTYSIWVAGDDFEDADLTVAFYDGNTYNTIFSWLKGDPSSPDDTWIELSGSITSGYWISNFRIQINTACGKSENGWVDDVLVTKTIAGNEEYFFGSVTEQVSLNSLDSYGFNRYNSVNPIETVESSNPYSFDQYKDVTEQSTVNSGNTYSMDKFDSATGVGTVNSLKTVALSQYFSVTTSTTIESVAEAITGTVLNLFGSIAQEMSINSYVLKTYAIYGTTTTQLTIVAYKTGTIDSFGSAIIQFTSDKQTATATNFQGGVTKKIAVTHIEGLDALIEGFVQRSFSVLGTRNVQFAIFPSAEATVTVQKTEGWDALIGGFIQKSLSTLGTKNIQFGLFPNVDAIVTGQNTNSWLFGSVLDFFGELLGSHQTTSSNSYTGSQRGLFFVDKPLTVEPEPLVLQSFSGVQTFEFVPFIDNVFELELTFFNYADEVRKGKIVFWLSKDGKELSTDEKTFSVASNSVAKIDLPYTIRNEGNYEAAFTPIVHHSEAVESETIIHNFTAIFPLKKPIVAAIGIVALLVVVLLIKRVKPDEKDKKTNHS